MSKTLYNVGYTKSTFCFNSHMFKSQHNFELYMTRCLHPKLLNANIVFQNRQHRFKLQFLHTQAFTLRHVFKFD